MCLCCTSSALALDLQPYEAVYQTRVGGFKVNVNQSFQVQGTNMSLSMDTKKMFFDRHERSTSSLSDEMLVVPSEYVYQRKGFGERRNRQLVFDIDAGTVKDVQQPTQAALPVPKHIQDKLSYQLQMRVDLMNSPAQERFEYTATDGQRLIFYSFQRLAVEVLDTPLGKLETIKFSQHRPDKDSEMFLWLAPKLDYLLVQFDEIEKPGGKPQQLLLKQLSIAGKSVKAPEP